MLFVVVITYVVVARLKDMNTGRSQQSIRRRQSSDQGCKEAVPGAPDWEYERECVSWRAQDAKKRRLDSKVTDKKPATEKQKQHGRKK